MPFIGRHLLRTYYVPAPGPASAAVTEADTGPALMVIRFKSKLGTISKYK